MFYIKNTFYIAGEATGSAGLRQRFRQEEINMVDWVKTVILRCNKNPIYVMFFWKLRGLSSNFHIHVSVRDLYIPRISPHISCRRIVRSVGVIHTSM
jgi:hypothetical protein